MMPNRLADTTIPMRSPPLKRRPDAPRFACDGERRRSRSPHNGARKENRKKQVEEEFAGALEDGSSPANDEDEFEVSSRAEADEAGADHANDHEGFVIDEEITVCRAKSAKDQKEYD